MKGCGGRVDYFKRHKGGKMISGGGVDVDVDGNE